MCNVTYTLRQMSFRIILQLVANRKAKEVLLTDIFFLVGFAMEMMAVVLLYCFLFFMIITFEWEFEIVALLNKKICYCVIGTTKF